jgi:hypothetical protein
MSESYRQERDRLLADVLSKDDWESGPLAQAALVAARCVRRRRAMRRGIAVGCATVLIAAAAIETVRFTAPPPKPDARSTAVAAAPGSLEIISDDELVALLSDRPVLLVKDEDGRINSVVWLSKPVEADSHPN